MAFNVPRVSGPEVDPRGVSTVMQNISTPDAMFGDGGKGLLNGADALDKLGASLDKRATNMLEEQNAARALELENLARREAMDAMYNPQTGLLTKRGGAALGADKVMADKMAAIKTKYTTIEGEAPDVRNMLSRKLTSLEDDMVGTATRHQFQELQSYAGEQIKARKEIAMQDAALNFNDEKAFAKNWADAEKNLLAESARNGWSPEELSVQRKQTYSGMRSAQIAAMTDQDTPDAILRAKKAYDEATSRGMMTFEDTQRLDKMFNAALPKAMAQVEYGRLGLHVASDQNQVIEYVMNNLEGGAAIAQEPGGAIAKYGINSAANPDINVKDLTQEDAAKLYKTRYWDAIGADQLPESMRFMAFDAAVNHGVDAAKAMIKKSGGDPRKLLEVRYEAYVNLVKKNPEKYGQYFDGWKDRLAKLSSQISNSPTEDSVALAAERLNLERPGAGDELIAMHKSRVAARDAEQKRAGQELLDQVMPTLYKNNGDWTELPVGVRNRAMELGVWEKITAYQGKTDPRLGVQLAQMSANQIMDTDFSDPMYRLNMSQGDYESLLKRQQSLFKNPGERGQFRQTRGIVAEAWRNMGGNVADVAYYQFQNVVEDAFVAEQEARGGRALTNDEKRTVVARLSLQTDVGTGWFDGPQKHVYEMAPDAAYTIEGYDPKLAKDVVSTLVHNNLPVDQGNVKSFIEDPSQFIKLDGYAKEDVNQAVQVLMRNGGAAKISPAVVKSFLDKKNGAKNG